MKKWQKCYIKTDDGRQVEGVAPVILSASRSTDIPAFYSKWFMNRLRKGYLVWINPFNHKPQYVSFEKCRLIVFWSKNPKPIFEHLDEFDQRNINYYFQYTLNDYEKEGFEPNVPKIEKRIETFKKLSEKIGKEKVIWRFDPLIITKEISSDELLTRIFELCKKLHKHTNKLVYSYVDIKEYKKVQNNLKRENVNYQEFTVNEKIKIAEELEKIKNEFNIKIATCCEDIELNSYGIEKNRCIDDEIIVNLFNDDSNLMEFIGYNSNQQANLFSSLNYIPNPKLKDRGQRQECGCIMSKDIGMYNTCNHLCVYCYANHSKNIVKKNLKVHNKKAHSIIEL